MPWTRDSKKKFRLGGIFLAISVCLVAGYLVRDPLSEYGRGLRAKYNLGKAEQALESDTEEEWKVAYQHALVARQLNPQSVEALRVLVDASFKTNSLRTLGYASALFLNENSNEEDKLYVLSILLQSRDHVGFVRLYNLIRPEVREKKDFVLVRVQFLIDRNAHESARKILETEVEGNRDRQFLLMLASLLVNPSASQKDKEEGQRLIAELASSENSDGIARTAFELLGYISLNEVNPEIFGDLGARIAKQENKSPGELLAAASLAIASAKDEKTREEIINHAIIQHGDIAPTRLASWLQRMGNNSGLLDFLTEERCSTDPALFQQRYSALLSVNRLDEAEEWLSNPPQSVDSISIWLAKAQLSRLRKQRSEENNAWEQAFQVAQNTGSRNEYLRIFEVASQSNRIDLATRALLKAPSQQTGIIPPAADLVGPMVFLTIENRLEDLRFLTEALVAREPNNVHLMNNLIYLNILLGDKIEESLKLADDLLSRNPRSLSLRTTTALGKILEGNPKQAYEVLTVDEEVWKTATTADRAIRSLVLGANGDPAAAAAEWSEVDFEDLTEAEKLLFAPHPGESFPRYPRDLPEDADAPREPDAPDSE